MHKLNIETTHNKCTNTQEKEVSLQYLKYTYKLCGLIPVYCAVYQPMEVIKCYINPNR